MWPHHQQNFWAGFGIIFHMELLVGEERGKFMMLTTQLARAFKIFSAKTLAAGGLLWLHLTWMKWSWCTHFMIELPVMPSLIIIIWGGMSLHLWLVPSLGALQIPSRRHPIVKTPWEIWPIIFILCWASYYYYYCIVCTLCSTTTMKTMQEISLL